ncbi:DNA binding domain-containing protein, excisionase family [Rhodoferax sp. OV413]|uniref:helix-turn-helix domain-containing protein n=1 Tax=Rhodoferax sp. OV413 TaxID=1855285 RepID=UPI00088D7964|nr:helix-turn-helix domain-containing protein [Rhodoferax sp. OV413]SDO18716.1 DNA binding domain-containing protein, excisionase family [Rhodoferax sp. OV413]
MAHDPTRISPPPPEDHYTTIEVARMLGLAVRSVQLMVDRGELEAWKTPGGHRRISRQSVERWRSGERSAAPAPDASAPGTSDVASAITRHGRMAGPVKLLLIEDSMHFQNLVSLLVRRQFPTVELQTASDGIAGLIMAGQFQPDVLMVDLLLPGIDGATLLAGLRAHPLFGKLQVIVITSLSPGELAPYTFALDGVPVVHKPQLVTDLPPLLAQCLEQVAGKGL